MFRKTFARTLFVTRMNLLRKLTVPSLGNSQGLVLLAVSHLSQASNCFRPAASTVQPTLQTKAKRNRASTWTLSALIA